MRALSKALLGLAALPLIVNLASAAPSGTDSKPSPVVAGAGYTPQDKDERGLWMQMEEAERDLKTSNAVIRDPALNAYVRDVFCRTVGQEECKDVRIYIVQTPYFNATMAPNGMMEVWSGLFLRVRNEAQLAAILGHEYTHYRNRHSIILFRSAKKTMVGAMIAGAFLGTLGQLMVLGGFFEHSREMEAEADSGALPMMGNAGYDPAAASAIWEQMRAEMDATAVARNKKSRKDKDKGMFRSHPPTAERMTTLKALAEKTAVTGTPTVNREKYRAALAPFWAQFVDDQIKMNDFGATEFLLENLAKEGWTTDLLYARGELYRTRGKPEDLTKAAELYRQVTQAADGPAEAWRGLGLSLVRSGVQAEGQAALKEYLKRKPDASDKSMIAMLAGGL